MEYADRLSGSEVLSRNYFRIFFLKVECYVFNGFVHTLDPDF